MKKRMSVCAISMCVFGLFLADDLFAACSSASWLCWHDLNKDGVKQANEWVTHYPTGEYGCALDYFKGVGAKSNGPMNSYTGTGCGNWQCVEFVRRFYYDAMGINLYIKPIGIARNFWDKYDDTGDYSYIKNSGLEKCENNYSTQIKPGDMIVFNISTYGHVAIDSGFLNNFIETEVIEQNYSEEEMRRPLLLLIQNGNHKIDSDTVLGWLHMPVGEFANDEYLRNGTLIAKGWHFDTDISGQSDHYNLNSRPFTVCYQTNGGRNLFGPSINKVHRFPDENSPYILPSPYYYMRFAWVQDFSNPYSNKTYTLVANEYVLNANTGYMGVAYWLEGPIRNYFFNNYWEIGYPVTNMYPYAGGYTSDPPRYMVQWFERLDEEYYVVIYDTWENRVWHESEHVTGVPRDEHLNQDLIKNSTPISDGLGGAAGEYVFNHSTICQTVTNGVPDGKDYAFYPEDGYVGIWFELNDIYNSLNISWKWYKPSGEFYGECNHITDTPPDGHLSKLKAWRFLNISGMTDYGTWRIELYVNGSKVDTQFFSLASPGDVPAIAPVITITAPQDFNILTVE